MFNIFVIDKSNITFNIHVQFVPKISVYKLATNYLLIVYLRVRDV